MTNSAANTIENGLTLVLGGTGKTGRRVVERLEALDVPVRMGSRSASPAFDWEDAATWAPVLRDVENVYLSYYPDVAAPGAPDAIRAFTSAAAGAGVRRVVMLSGRGEPEAQECERIVRESGLAWTVVRSSWFAQNFSEDYLLDPVRAGEVVLPAGDVPEPFVDADDIADVAVAALTRDGHAGEVYEVTGPRALTFAEAVAEIGRAAGRGIAFVPVAADDYAAALTRHGLPEEVVGLLTYLFTTVLDGRNARPADGVRRALGREPRDFAGYARDTAASGIWNA
ncbi:NmrA family transcriptional regulator [Actinomadura darangshiensis]|uniref:NmrA family transcriptional regulator n=1 Tax=Actinomadura darangshiensis TaxID=705336 RepID=A0A4V2YXA1_9ACTN|nr:NAD(P)H-binding protein [Actinomadura darangshiensis]TDD88647.1 NmrA family transcriptional regulator [Actinomadura darangshiensis]